MHHTQYFQRGLPYLSAIMSVASAGLLYLLLALVLAPLPVMAQGAIICVSPTGDYATIQEAVDAASDGDEIRVGSGVFKENVVITKTLDRNIAGFSGQGFGGGLLVMSGDAETLILPAQGS